MPGWGDKSNPINILYQKGKKVNKSGATKIDSIPTSNADVGPVPTAKEVKSTHYAESLLVLDDIIENVKKVGSSANTKNRVNPFSYYEGTFKTEKVVPKKIDGKMVQTIQEVTYKVNMRIKDAPDMSRYHYHTLEGPLKVGEIDEIKIEPLHGTYPEKDMNLLEADSITNNIPEPSAKSNDNTEIPDESLHKHVTEMREKQFTDDDILAQFEKMGVNPQKAFEAVDNTNAKKYKKQILEELGDSDFLEGSPTIHTSINVFRNKNGITKRKSLSVSSVIPGIAG